jgi:predicted pyridoxine 5'-phosphate oxidase superfamily flavin-nucleotide-binding protein
LIRIQHKETDSENTIRRNAVAKIEGKVKEVMEKTEVVAIGTWGGDGPHLVATWGGFVRTIGIKDGEIIIIPAGGYHKTEENLKSNDRVQVLVASKEVERPQGSGTGFRLSGRGEVQTEGELVEMIKSKFSWARGALVIYVDEVKCLL